MAGTKQSRQSCRRRDPPGTRVVITRVQDLECPRERFDCMPRACISESVIGFGKSDLILDACRWEVNCIWKVNISMSIDCDLVILQSPFYSHWILDLNTTSRFTFSPLSFFLLLCIRSSSSRLLHHRASDATSLSPPPPTRLRKPPPPPSPTTQH